MHTQFPAVGMHPTPKAIVTASTLSMLATAYHNKARQLFGRPWERGDLITKAEYYFKASVTLAHEQLERPDFDEQYRELTTSMYARMLAELGMFLYEEVSRPEGRRMIRKAEDLLENDAIPYNKFSIWLNMLRTYAPSRRFEIITEGHLRRTLQLATEAKASFRMRALVIAACFGNPLYRVIEKIL